MSKIDPNGQQRPLQLHVERIAEDVAGIAVECRSVADGRVINQEPTQVAPEKTYERAVWVFFMVGFIVMLAMRGHPTGRSVFQAAEGDHYEEPFHPKWAAKATMG